MSAHSNSSHHYQHSFLDLHHDGMKIEIIVASFHFKTAVLGVGCRTGLGVSIATDLLRIEVLPCDH